jgi:hypothetical protein
MMSCYFLSLILKAVAAEFSVTHQTCSRLWKGWHASHATALNGEWVMTSGKKGSGHGLKYNQDDVAQGRGPLTMTSLS